MSAACARSKACVNEYGANSTRAMERWLGGSVLPHSAFMDGCSRHCDGGKRPLDPRHIRVDGDSPLQAFAAWRASLARRGAARRVWHQAGSYPCGSCCGALEEPVESAVAAGVWAE